MSTGISISSINRIKELAEEKKFKEALEILDTQNLDKSINPQFLKISGEIFRENKRYYDSRRILLKAHQMAPQGNRIIHELIQLYLELGYFSKAQKYYEQYLFYTTPDDTQKDYVEYIMKKATGADVKELATILIPILERMPEDKWNFEAILLYHKMDRKDMALEESRYILENFKESSYVQPVIDYIDDKLDVDKWFYVYPREEQPEDEEQYGDLIKLEETILENDYRSMYPPEARIMVEADDHDAVNTAPVKEKKSKKLFNKNAKKEAVEQEQLDAEVKEEIKEDEKAKDTQADKPPVDVEKPSSEDKKENASDVSDAKELDDKQPESSSDTSDDLEQETDHQVTLEEDVQKEREEALEKILSKKFDRDKLKESAKQIAQAVKDIDATKAKQQVKSVADTVKDNVKKASDVFNEAVGTKQASEKIQDLDNSSSSDDDEIMDGIIESVLEAPKKAVGQVVMNEELDALVPDSLEAMSVEEIADIEAKKEEQERLELEALEATLKLEEEKKAKKLAKSKANSAQEEEQQSEEDAEPTVAEDVEQVKQDEDAQQSSDNVEETTADSDGSSYAELKTKFMEAEDEKPLDSLGFITVVHSDVDEAIEDAVPDAAGMLRQMIDNKEFYAGESSLGFESKASYENHGFEVEDYDFDVYRMKQEETSDDDMEHEEAISMSEETVSVQEIFTKESVVAFEDVVSEDAVTEEPVLYEEEVVEEPVLYEEEVAEEPVLYEEEAVEEPVLYEEEVVEEPVSYEEETTEEPVLYEEEAVEEPVLYEEEVVEEPVLYEEEAVEEPVLYEEEVVEEPVLYEEEAVEETVSMRRDGLRADIVLTFRMENLLQELKESR